MKKDSIIDFLGFIAVKVFSGILHFMPLRCAIWLGRGAGDCIYIMNHKRRAIAYANLKAAFPLKDVKELNRINRAHFRNLAMNVVELLKIPHMDRRYLQRYIEIQGDDYVKAAVEKGRGVIFLTAHFGNWEISSLAGSMHGYVMSVFARRQKYKRLNSLLNKYRESTGCRVITKGFSIRDIIKTLNRGGIVGMLADQDAGPGGVFIDFLGRPASMAKGPLVFSLKTGAKIIPCFIRRVRFNKHTIWIERSFEPAVSQDGKMDIKKDLQRLGDILTREIIRYPDQWLWAHKRWKNTPQRNIIVLTDGKPGHFNQAMGVTGLVEEALRAKLHIRGIGENPIVKIDTIEIRFKSRLRRVLLDIMSFFAGRRCQGCLKCMEFCLDSKSFEAIKNRYADIIISCGSSTISTNIFLKYENNAKNIILMRPGFGRLGKFDLIILPWHDKPLRIKKNMLILDISPTRISEEIIRDVLERNRSQLGQLDDGGIGILIGGDTGTYRLTKDIIEKIIEAVIRLADEMDINLYISTSRRTSPEIEEFLKVRLQGYKRCKLLIIASEYNPPDTVAFICGLSKVVIVSSESVSMISEAVSSERKVIVFGEIEGNKYRRFIDNLEKKGYIKVAPLSQVYNITKDILGLNIQPRRPPDREKIIEMLKRIV